MVLWQIRTCRCDLPQRYITCTMLLVGYCLEFTLSTSFDLSINQYLESMKLYSNVCEELNVTTLVSNKNPNNFKLWTRVEYLYGQHLYYAGILIAAIPAGIISDRRGAKYVLETSILGSSVIALITPVLFTVSDRHVVVLYFMRFFGGLFYGGADVSLHAFVGYWSIPSERLILCTLVYSGTNFGYALNIFVTPKLLYSTSYIYTAFYVYGSLLLVWVFFFQFFFFSTYRQDRWISSKEFNLIDEQLGSDIKLGKKIIPWMKMFKSTALWSIIFVAVAYHIFLSICKKRYMHFAKEQLSIDTKYSLKYIALIFFVNGFMTIIFGIFTQCIINKGYIGILSSRKMNVTFGVMGGPIFFYISTFSRCVKTTFLLISAFGVFFMSLYNSGGAVNSIDIAPNFCGTIKGFSTVIEIIVGTFFFILVEFVYFKASFVEWRNQFVYVFICFFLANIFFMIFASVDIQIWNYPRFKATDMSATRVRSPGVYAVASRATLPYSKSGIEQRRSEIFKNRTKSNATIY